MYMHKQVNCASYVQEFSNNIKAIYALHSFLTLLDNCSTRTVECKKTHNTII